MSGVEPSTFQLVQFELNMLNVLGENTYHLPKVYQVHSIVSPCPILQSDTLSAVEIGPKSGEKTG